MGFDEYIWRYSTSDRPEFDKIKKRNKEHEVLFVDRETRIVSNQLSELKERRVVRGLPNGEVALQSLPCYCTGCRVDGECLYNEVSGKNSCRIESRVLIEGGSYHKIATVEPKEAAPVAAAAGGAPGMVAEKQVPRVLVDVEVQDVGGEEQLQYTDDKAGVRQVGVRHVVAFKNWEGGGQGFSGWGAGVVQASNGAELVVTVMLRSGGVAVHERDVVVQKEHTVLCSNTQPNLVAHKLVFEEGVLNALNLLYL